jgi:hypothetical protein
MLVNGTRYHASDLMAGMRERGEERVLGRKAGRPGRVNSYRPDRFPANRPRIYEYAVAAISKMRRIS